ncbi:hypothetical protein FRC06_005890 [Ceratobasidium sp. 370]|nr:hypothetical protein FRC06_005890 [Ceratobasidium sp. 370]
MVLGSGEVVGVFKETWSEIVVVATLKQILSQEVLALKDKRFSMYKADIPFGEVNEIGESDVQDPRFRLLRWQDSLAELWPNGFDLRVHLIIELVQDAKPPPSHQQSASYGIKELVRIQTSTIKYLNNKDSPSQAAKPSNLVSIQAGKRPIHNGRPYTLTGRPIALYNQIFNEFKAAATRPPTTEYLDSTGTTIFEFIRHSREIYQHEDARLKSLTPLLDFSLDFHLSQEIISRCIDDRVVKRGEGGYLLVSEWKNEVGTGGCDPSVQAAFSYVRYWGQETMRPLRDLCCCPSFILAIAGPWMCLLGAVFLEQPIVEPLTDFIWIGPRDCLSDGVRDVAQVFQALATSLKALRSFYNHLDKGVASGRFFPWITYFWDVDGQIVNFRYLKALGGDHQQQKAVFKAQTMGDNPQTIVVKFTRRYNGQAHKLLAERGYAPKLLFDGSEHPDFPRPASLLMIVMGFVVEAPRGPRYDEAYSTLRTALDILHSQQLVFGDLRPPNILVPKLPADQEARAMLIDFDWCGKDGEDRYPWDINIGTITWAAGVGPGALMHKHHDDFMLETKLF